MRTHNNKEVGVEPVHLALSNRTLARWVAKKGLLLIVPNKKRAGLMLIHFCDGSKLHIYPFTKRKTVKVLKRFLFITYYHKEETRYWVRYYRTNAGMTIYNDPSPFDFSEDGKNFSLF